MLYGPRNSNNSWAIKSCLFADEIRSNSWSGLKLMLRSNYYITSSCAPMRPYVIRVDCWNSCCMVHGNFDTISRMGWGTHVEGTTNKQNLFMAKTEHASYSWPRKSFFAKTNKLVGCVIHGSISFVAVSTLVGIFPGT